MSELYTAALVVAAIGAMARLPAVAYAWCRTFLARRRFVNFRFGWVEFLANLEPIALLALGYHLLGTVESGASPTGPQTLIATFGATLGLAGWGFQVWTFFSWTSLFAGHGVLDGQRLLTHGAYSVVRHPAYLGILLVWLGLALAFLSLFVLALTVFYTIPVYVLYLRGEEVMMVESFGDEYRRYRRRVPMLVPLSSLESLATE